MTEKNLMNVKYAVRNFLIKQVLIDISEFILEKGRLNAVFAKSDSEIKALWCDTHEFILVIDRILVRNVKRVFLKRVIFQDTFKLNTLHPIEF
jgi:hypothetical protein